MRAYICVKGHSIRCPRKNHTLLPYVLSYAKDYFDVVVITDSEELANIANEYGVKVYYEQGVHKISEFHAIHEYLRVNGGLDDNDEFVVLPVTQPFRTKETMVEVRDIDMTNHDVVTTYTTVSNRSIFLLNNDNMFKYDSFNRKGCMCPTEKMADGSMYKMHNCFLKHIVDSEDSNHEFWHSRMLFVENTHPISLDVDEPKDLEIFNMINK